MTAEEYVKFQDIVSSDKDEKVYLNSAYEAFRVVPAKIYSEFVKDYKGSVSNITNIVSSESLFNQPYVGADHPETPEEDIYALVQFNIGKDGQKIYFANLKHPDVFESLKKTNTNYVCMFRHLASLIGYVCRRYFEEEIKC